MARENLKRLLWESTLRLMEWRYGEENLSRLARDCQFGPGTPSRIKDQKTEVRLSTIETLANRFGFEAWQLLVTGFDPQDPPRLASSKLPSDEEELLRLYRALDRDTQPALLNRAASLQEAVVKSRVPRKSKVA